jgi:pilus assembly protein CpaF
MESDVITLQELYEFKIDQVLQDGVVVGGLRPTGLRPNFLHKFQKRGVELPAGMFGNGGAALGQGFNGDARRDDGRDPFGQVRR